MNRPHFTARLCALAVAGASLVSCIDEDLSDCGTGCRMDYTVWRSGALDSETAAVLAAPGERAVARRLAEELAPVFTGAARDLRLTWSAGGAAPRTETHVPDAGHATLTVRLPAGSYSHVALANTAAEPAVRVGGGGASPTVEQAGADTVGSHRTGLFAARRPMTVGGGGETFGVDLHMINCTAALVVDCGGTSPEAMTMYAAGLADAFRAADSAYVYGRGQLVRAVRLGGVPAPMACLYACGFASRNSAPGGGALWQLRVYVTVDGRTTESVLSVGTPLEAGGMRIIKARLNDDGSIATDAPEVGVSVTLDWKPGGVYEPEV